MIAVESQPALANKRWPSLLLLAHTHCLTLATGLRPLRPRPTLSLTRDRRVYIGLCVVRRVRSSLQPFDGRRRRRRDGGRVLTCTLHWYWSCQQRTSAHVWQRGERPERAEQRIERAPLIEPLRKTASMTASRVASRALASQGDGTLHLGPWQLHTPPGQSCERALGSAHARGTSGH